MWEAQAIQLLHTALILFIVLVPLYDMIASQDGDTQRPLTIAFLALGAILIHWATNDDTCGLTLMESRLTGKSPEDTFLGRVIKPVYNGDDIGAHVWTLSVVWFLFMTYLLATKYRFEYLCRALGVLRIDFMCPKKK